MELRRFEHVEEFYRHAEPFLVTREAEHCLPLGIVGGLLRDPAQTPHPYLALVEDQGRVRGVALRTPPYNVVVSLQHDSNALTLFVQDLRATSGAIPGVVGPADVSQAFARAWSALTGSSHRAGLATLSYKLTQVQPPAGVSGHMRPATEADRELLVEWMSAFHQEALQINDRAVMERTVDKFLHSADTGLVLWLNPEPVSMAGFSGPTPHGIRIVTVYTPPERRGQGYASACVAALSQQLLDQGRRFCFLFTDVTNHIANKIYQNIGYEPVCAYQEHRFESVSEHDPRSRA